MGIKVVEEIVNSLEMLADTVATPDQKTIGGNDVKMKIMVKFGVIVRIESDVS